MSESIPPADEHETESHRDERPVGPDAGGAASERTGLPAVDQVLAEIESVGELPVAERVAVFERAHERLRRALDADPVAEIAGTVQG